MRIDGDASTTLYRFEGSRDELDFLKYDVTTLACRIRNAGKAALLGGGYFFLIGTGFMFVEIGLMHRLAIWSVVTAAAGAAAP